MSYCGMGGMDSVTVRLSMAASRYCVGQSRRGTRSVFVSLTNVQLGHHHGQYRAECVPLEKLPLVDGYSYMPLAELDST